MFRPKICRLSSIYALCIPYGTPAGDVIIINDNSNTHLGCLRCPSTGPITASCRTKLSWQLATITHRATLPGTAPQRRAIEGLGVETLKPPDNCAEGLHEPGGRRRLQTLQLSLPRALPASRSLVRLSKSQPQKPRR